MCCSATPRCSRARRKVQNFVFDAVINGLVCRMFPRADFTSFFTDYYSADSFPHCLLRPAPGWPEKPVMPEGVRALPAPLRARVKDVHIALYSSAGATYQEVFDALPKLLDEGVISGIPLLGGHEGDGKGASQLEHRSPVLFDAVRGIVEQWPQPPDPIRGRSLADVLKDADVQVRRVPSNRAILRGLIRKLAGVNDAGAIRRARVEVSDAPTPIPGLGRRSMVLRALGHEPLLHAGPTSLAATGSIGRARARVHRRLRQHGLHQGPALRRGPRLRGVRPSQGASLLHEGRGHRHGPVAARRLQVDRRHGHRLRGRAHGCEPDPPRAASSPTALWGRRAARIT